MMGSAQLEILPEDETVGDAGAAAGLRREAAERLAAHRMRRARQASESAGSREDLKGAGKVGKRGAVAAAVAERYAQTPSYRAMLADEARRAMEQAAAAAEVALRNAEAVVAVQNELLAELGKWEEPVAFSAATAAVESVAARENPAENRGPAAQGAATLPASVVKEISAGGLTVRLYEDVGPVAPVATGRRNKGGVGVLDAEEARALDDEIAFRQAPVFEVEPPPEPSVPLPANLLEFPRQLVAAKKARPRLAEMPLLLEEAARNPQLRIFEVEPQIELAPEPVHTAPEWHSIWLDAHTVTEVVESPSATSTAMLPSLLPPQVAALHLRVMAAVVDALLVMGATVAFCAAAVKVAGVAPDLRTLGMAAGVMLAALYFGYQLLFFTLSDATPGMRYARIGLCTFSDENPSRGAMRKRILAQVVAVCPLGIGVLWMLLDDDRLGWHDRISRMYQRAY